MSPLARRLGRTALVAALAAICVPAAVARADWSLAPGLAGNRFEHTATLIPSGEVLVAGGQIGPDVTSTAELYDPATNTWSPAASMSVARVLHTATLLPNGKVLVAGGSPAGASAELPPRHEHVVARGLARHGALLAHGDAAAQRLGSRRGRYERRVDVPLG